MTNYSTDPGHVRITWFKASGKYYTEEMLDMNSFYWAKNFATPVAAVIAAIARGKGIKGMTAVVLEPYHEYPYPVMIVDWQPTNV